MNIGDLASYLGKEAAYWPPLPPAPVAGARSLTELTYGIVYGYRPLVMDVHVPEGDAPDGGWPCVLWVHGGSWRGGDRRYVPLEWPQNALFEKLVAAGMAVATIDYRRVDEQPMPACVHDTFAALRYLREFAGELEIDPERIGIWGESAGAHLAGLVALAGTEQTPDPRLVGTVGVGAGRTDVACCVWWYGVACMRSVIEMAASQPSYEGVDVVGSFVDGGMEMAELCAPVNHVHADAPPFLVMAGDRDLLLPHSTGLHEALRAAGVPSEMDVVQDADHVFAGREVEPFLDRAVAWLRERLAA